MKCEICGKEAQLVVLLSKKQEDGKLDTFACLQCAKESGLYCLKHEESHIDFNGAGTACLTCLKEREVELESQGSVFLGQLKEALPDEEYKRIVDGAGGLAKLLEKPLEAGLLKYIVCAAVRLKKKEEEVVEMIIVSQTANSLFF